MNDRLVLYVKDNCDFCKQVVIPEELKIKTININDPSYDGAMPQNVPHLEIKDGTGEPISMNSPGFLNKFFSTLVKAQDGIYSK